MAGTNAGALGSRTNQPPVDSGTLSLQCTQPPGATGRAPVLDLGTGIVVGLSRRAAGYNFDGTVAEDMLYGDAPAQSAPIRSDPVFAQSDAQLEAGMTQLMESLSVGDMETVALEMKDRFCRGVGGTYHSPLLDQAIYDHEAFGAYHRAFERELTAMLKSVRYDMTRVTPLPMRLLDFSSYWDKATGLGITVHQVWAVRAVLNNVRIDCAGPWWQFDLVYTFYDHFGLDWPDVVKNGDRILPQYHTGDFFKAWYILQHYRRARPFITTMRRTVFKAGRLD
jgi:hypothetical protein